MFIAVSPNAAIRSVAPDAVLAPPVVGKTTRLAV
jgi:hypothetical protein